MLNGQSSSDLVFPVSCGILVCFRETFKFSPRNIEISLRDIEFSLGRVSFPRAIIFSLEMRTFTLILEDFHGELLRFPP
jgi:hypothetical protein